jgi:hypothetical protein
MKVRGYERPCASAGCRATRHHALPVNALWRWIFVLGGVGVAGAIVALATGGWYLQCADSAGNPLGGIDCLGSAPKTDTVPAEWLGFYGWVAVCLVCIVLVALALVRLRRARHAE